MQQLTQQVKARMYERLAERERIARDLHDTFFQSVQGILLRFHTITSSIAASNPLRSSFEETLTQSDQIMLEGREIMLDLRSTLSKPEDLQSQLKEYGLRNIDAGCSYRVIVIGTVQALHPVAAAELSSIAKEAVYKAFLHASASAIEAELEYQPNRLRMCIRDDGAGIAAEVLSRGERDRHWGLPNMRDRAHKLGTA